MRWFILVFVATGIAIVPQFVSIFVVQPIGALPEGVTAVITRPSGVNFIDSPDGWCQRTQGSVSLLCRGAAGARVVNNSTIILRLPYSATLYSYSTGGRSYDR